MRGGFFLFSVGLPRQGILTGYQFYCQLQQMFCSCTSAENGLIRHCRRHFNGLKASNLTLSLSLLHPLTPRRNTRQCRIFQWFEVTQKKQKQNRKSDMENVLTVPYNILIILLKNGWYSTQFQPNENISCSNAQTLPDDVTSEKEWYGALKRHLSTMHHPKNIFRDTPFMTYTNCYTFRHGVIITKVYKVKCLKLT